MDDKQKEKTQARRLFKAAFYFLLAWACAAAFASNRIKPVHATIDLCRLTRQVFLLQPEDWEADFEEASAILHSTALPADGHVHTPALSAVHQFEEEK